MQKFSAAFLFILGACCISTRAQAVTVDFEDVPLPSGGYYNGSDLAGGFTSRGVFFPNTFTDWGYGITSWDNWACSSTTDTITGDVTNQYSAITGKGQGSSAQYAVGFPSFTTGMSNFSLPYPNALQGAYFTNTTYAYYTMLNGNRFAKKFGGASGTDPDWFLLTITGKNAEGASVGFVDFYLADYRDPDPNNHYILNQWTWVDFSGLGSNVKSLEFGMLSSDYGKFGINTPTYFAMDTLSTPMELSWTGSQNSIWSNAGNWSSAIVPGSGQNVLFNKNINTAINLNGDRRIRNIAFDTALAGSFTLNNNTLTLDAGGSITVTGAVATSQTFNCKLGLAGNGFLVNDGVAPGRKLIVNGDIQSAASSGIQNLTLGGAGNGIISGTISDGTSGGALALVKQGSGTWTISGTMDYTSDTTIETGTLQITGTTANLHAISGQGDLTVGDGSYSTTLTADSIAVSTLTIAAGAEVVINAISGGPTAGGSDMTAVPEPCTFALLAIAALGLLIWSKI
jgi:autotransporter-associated beta strand protein